MDKTATAGVQHGRFLPRPHPFPEKAHAKQTDARRKTSPGKYTAYPNINRYARSTHQITMHPDVLRRIAIMRTVASLSLSSPSFDARASANPSSTRRIIADLP